MSELGWIVGHTAGVRELLVGMEKKTCTLELGAESEGLGRKYIKDPIDECIKKLIFKHNGF